MARSLVLGELEDPLANRAKEGALARVEKELDRVVEEAVGAGVPLPRSRQEIIELYDRLYVERVLAQHRGNISHAAIAAGIGRRYFQIIRARQRESG